VRRIPVAAHGEGVAGDLRDAALLYFYFGFFSALQRHRRIAILGWVIVCCGSASLFLGWNLDRIHGLIDLALSACTIIAGLALVQQSISHLASYVRVPFPYSITPEGTEPWVQECSAMMEEVDEGGWREAFDAIRELRRLGERNGLPAPDGRENPHHSLGRVNNGQQVGGV
jgi:hypothetical protein